MYLQAKNIKDYFRANEVLYVLNASTLFGDGVISKIGLQKIIYLSVTLSPIKDIILSFLRFQYYYRGPYSFKIQNTIDHLVAIGLVEITSIRQKAKNSLFVDYRISASGKLVVENLIKYSEEDEKSWWINTIFNIALLYSKENYSSEWGGLDRIVDIVYEDPSFVEAKKQGLRYNIDLASEGSITKSLILFAKDYLEKYRINITQKNERKIAEILIIAFFEYFTSNIINAKTQDV